jgi:hypothetical protein
MFATATCLNLPEGLAVAAVCAVDNVVLVGSSEGIVHVVTQGGALVSRFSTLHLGVVSLHYNAHSNR